MLNVLHLLYGRGSLRSRCFHCCFAIMKTSEMLPQFSYSQTVENTSTIIFLWRACNTMAERVFVQKFTEFHAISMKQLVQILCMLCLKGRWHQWTFLDMTYSHIFIEHSSIITTKKRIFLCMNIITSVLKPRPSLP